MSLHSQHTVNTTTIQLSSVRIALWDDMFGNENDTGGPAAAGGRTMRVVDRE
jgi:hypothetical protein